MKSLALILLTTFLSMIAASVIPETSLFFDNTDSSPAGVVTWPADAAAYRLRRRSGLSNSERLQRGLQPSKPRNLYVNGSAALAKRVADPPAAARVSGTAGVYRFTNCGNQAQGGTGYRVNTVTFTDLQELANNCAALQDALGNGAGTLQSFAIVDRPANNCYISARNPGAAITCVAGQGAFYSLST